MGSIPAALTCSSYIHTIKSKKIDKNFNSFNNSLTVNFCFGIFTTLIEPQNLYSNIPSEISNGKFVIPVRLISIFEIKNVS